jgi:alkylated DNA repair dioxygenase AlkB
MPQLPLFEPTPGVLIDDARGRVDYTPAFLPPETAAAWFRELREAVPWKALRRQMYDREVEVPRLIGHYRLDEEGTAVPSAVREAAARVVEHAAAPFNSVGLNLYRDGRDSVAPHNDHLYEIAEGFPIALVSLGTMRRMTIRAKRPPRRVVHVDLEPGSLLLMSYETQLHFTHAVPKTRDPVGERISLAFRVKPPRGAPDGARGGLYR